MKVVAILILKNVLVKKTVSQFAIRVLMVLEQREMVNISKCRLQVSK